jgi:hypothetical protein
MKNGANGLRNCGAEAFPVAPTRPVALASVAFERSQDAKGGRDVPPSAYSGAYALARSQHPGWPAVGQTITWRGLSVFHPGPIQIHQLPRRTNTVRVQNPDRRHVFAGSQAAKPRRALPFDCRRVQIDGPLAHPIDDNRRRTSPGIGEGCRAVGQPGFPGRSHSRILLL